MNRLGMVALVVLLSAMWWFLSRSVSLTAVVASTGLGMVLSSKQSPRAIVRDLLIASLWASVVNLYIRTEWGQQPV